MPTAETTGPDHRRVPTRWRSWLPVLLLLAVAATQVTLATTAGLSPWKGGGFGMFASTDGSAFRRVRLFLEHDGLAEEIEVPGSLQADAAKLVLFPSDTRLRGFADAVIARERRNQRPVTSVRVEVWTTTFEDGPLRAVESPLRSVVQRAR